MTRGMVADAVAGKVYFMQLIMKRRAISCNTLVTLDPMVCG